MKYLLSKEHYPYKIHTLLMKRSAYTPPPLPCHFYKKILIYIFFKNPSPLYK